MKCFIPICIILTLTLSFLQPSEACNSKSARQKAEAHHHHHVPQLRPQTAQVSPTSQPISKTEQVQAKPMERKLLKPEPETPKRTHNVVQVEPTGKPTGPKPPKPEMPSMMGCMDAGFPGSPAYSQCMRKFSKDMSKYARKMKAWNAKYGEKLDNNDTDGDFSNNSIYSNGWRIKSEGGGTSMSNFDGDMRITVTPDRRVDQVKGKYLGKNTMEWVLMHRGKQVGWVKVKPPPGTDAKKLKHKYSSGALKIWRE